MSSRRAEFAQPFSFERLRGKLPAERAVDALRTIRDSEED
jgi:hypothetical protein